MDIAWLQARPDSPDEPETCSLGGGFYYCRCNVEVGVCWARRGDRLYRLEVQGTAISSFLWRLIRAGRLVAKGLMKPPRFGGLREALGTARELCEKHLRLDTTLDSGSSPTGVQEVGDKALDRVLSGRRSAVLRHQALRALYAQGPAPTGGPEEIGGRLRWARCRQGLPLAGLAVRAGVSTSSAQRMEHSGGRELPLGLWLKVAGALRVDPGWLLLGRGAPDLQTLVSPPLDAEKVREVCHA